MFKLQSNGSQCMGIWFQLKVAETSAIVLADLLDLVFSLIGQRHITIRRMNGNIERT